MSDVAYGYFVFVVFQKMLKKKRGPLALTVTRVSETLHWLLVRRAHIGISTAASKNK